MVVYKLRRIKVQRKNTAHRDSVQYTISLPKLLIEEIAGWRPNEALEVEWIPKGKNTVMNVPYFRISRPDNLWVDKRV